MPINVATEFQVAPFARHYEELSDTFIDMRAVCDSLKQHIPAGSALFELGLGTGYFASQFTAAGYTVMGIQPADEMLPKLKQSHPEIKVVAEAKLEEYEFTERHESIVSHSSVFLFTRHEIPFGSSGEILSVLVFQSFITREQAVYANLFKTLRALTPSGRLFINVQRNPLPRARVGPSENPLTFEMTDCIYSMDLGFVEKRFTVSHGVGCYTINDRRFCAVYAEFARRVGDAGGRCSITEDGLWVIIDRES